MSVKVREKSSKGSEPSKKYEQSSGNGSCTTLEADPSLEFKKMRQSLHNLFELAKKEITTLYQVVLNQVSSIGLRIGQRRKISQQLVQQMCQIKKKAEQAMFLLPQKLRSLLVSPKIMQKVTPQSQELNKYGYQYLKPEPEHKRTRTSGSIDKRQLSVTDIDMNCRNGTRKITSTSVKSIDNLKFLEATWPYLEHIQLQNKSISSTCNFQKVTANSLQVLNLSCNDVSDLSCFSNCYFPSLTHLNLSKNRVKVLDGLESAKFPKLAVLNLSKNSISCLKPLSKLSLPDLYQLHLEGNRLENVQFIGSCDFGNLEILNLDSNKLKHLQDLSQITFYRLKYLSFSNNSVTSLEFLSRMSLRRLQGLIAHNNRIRELEPLTKGSFPALKQIILHNNEITDITCIKRMDFPELSGFDLEFNKIQRFSIGCFLANDRGYRDAKKKYSFILI